MNTQRLGEVYLGQWAIHTHTGQIGQVIGWDDNNNTIKFKTWGGTRGTGDSSGRGFINADDKDMFRAATGYEIRGYVNGDWGWAPTDGQSLLGVEDPITIQTPGVPSIAGEKNATEKNDAEVKPSPVVEKIIDSLQVEESSLQLPDKIELHEATANVGLLEDILARLCSIEQKLDSIFK